MKNLPFFLLFLVVLVTAQAQTAPPTRPMTPHVAKPNPNGVTLDDLKELGAARKAALKADPALEKEQAALQQKIRDFQHKVDQAILQANPELSEVIAKLENNPVPRLPLPAGPFAPPSLPASSPPRQ